MVYSMRKYSTYVYGTCALFIKKRVNLYARMRRNPFGSHVISPVAEESPLSICGTLPLSVACSTPCSPSCSSCSRWCSIRRGWLVAGRQLGKRVPLPPLDALLTLRTSCHHAGETEPERRPHRPPAARLEPGCERAMRRQEDVPPACPNPYSVTRHTRPRCSRETGCTLPYRTLLAQARAS